ncbi:MAG: hypothetical protein V1776_05220 [Candidatus Diapherotrites archaeon]
MTRHTFWILGFLLLLTPVLALELDAPEQVPSYSPFTFRVILPSTEAFSTATIMFDNIGVATIYNSGTCLIQPDWIPFLIHCKTYDTDPKTNEGLTAIITHTGFAKGIHTISIQSQGIEGSFSSTEVKVITPLEDTYKDELNSEITNVKGRVEELETFSQGAQQKINETQSQLEQTIHETGEKINTLKDLLSAQFKNAEKVVQQSSETFTIPFLSGNGTGLATGVNAPVLGILLIVAFASLILFAGIGRKKKTGFGGIIPKDNTPFLAGNLDTLFKGLPEKKNMEERISPQPKKWSSDVEEELRDDIENNPPEKSKVNFGDLIRNERD